MAKTIEAIGLNSTLSSAVLESLQPSGSAAGLSYDTRIATLKALSANAAQLGPADRQALADVAAAHLREDYAPLRVAGAQALGSIGRLDLLEGALRDEHYEVRRAALEGLAAAGPRALPYAGAALDALDPFAGTAEAAAKVAVAMGPGALPEVQRRASAAPEALRPLFAAAARAVSLGDAAPVREALAQGFVKGPNDTGYVRIDTLFPGAGKPYDHSVHRIQVDVRGAVYGPGRERGKRIQGVRTEENTTYNPFFLALQGHPAGARLRMIMSPEVALSPFAHAPQPGPRLPPGTASDFDIEIRKVCEPQIWEIFKGGGIFGPIRFETSCS
jgi:hypothetical protein